MVSWQHMRNAIRECEVGLHGSAEEEAAFRMVYAWLLWEYEYIVQKHRSACGNGITMR